MQSPSHQFAISGDEKEVLDENKFILFRLGRELYGTKLLDVREVVEPLPIKKIPNTVVAFEGVSNLRGQIVGVLDLRVRFQSGMNDAKEGVLLVFDTDSGSIAARVDEIHSVANIPASEIDIKTSYLSKVPGVHIQGIGKLSQGLVTLIDLKQLMLSEEIVEVSLKSLSENISDTEKKV